MYSKFWTVFVALATGFGTYFLYAVIVVPVFIMPRTARQRVNMPRPAANASSEVERISRENSELLSAVFPDPNDWRRIHPLSVIPKDRSWLLLFPREPREQKGILTFDKCTIVIPSADRHFSEIERFRRAIVIETNDKVEFVFKSQLGLHSLAEGFSPSNLERGQTYGEVSVWSNMEPEDRTDDFLLTTRNIVFTSEQIRTYSEVTVRYGNQQAEGVGLCVNIDLPSQNRETGGSNDGPSPADEFAEGNLAFGFSIRDVSLDKLSLLEFEMPDYLPTVPGADIWEGDVSADDREPDAPDGEAAPSPVTINVRCRDGVYFAPKVTDAISVWCACFSGNVEITASHKERQPDSLRCDSLCIYLSDPVLQEKWQELGSLYKGKRRPTGRLTRLTPYQVRATGSPERKSSLLMAGGFFDARGGEIICEVDRRRISLQPLSAPASGESAPDAQEQEDDVTLQYGRASVVSNRIEFVYDADSFGELRAYKKGRLETDLPNDDPAAAADHLTVTWNDLVQIAPIPDEPNLYAASFRGGVRAESKTYGLLTAREADFWFKADPKQGEESVEESSQKVTPQSARLRGDVEMTTPRGVCRVRDDLEILFDQEKETAPNAESPAAASVPASGAEKNPFAAGGSLMGEGGNAVYSLSSGSLKIWALLRRSGGVDISHILMRDQFLFVETDPVERKEVLHIDGSDVRIENPSSSRVSIVLRGRPANFTGSGLNLSGYDIRVNRPENMFSVIGSGRLRFVVPKEPGMPAGSGAVSDEPVEVWWPNGMTFDGRTLVFQGKVQPQGGAAAPRPKDNELVNVRQGRSLELKSPLISLALKQPIQIFDFDMGKDSSGASRLQLDRTTCQGTPAAPVSVTWFGTVPSAAGEGNGGTPLRGRGSGEATVVTIHADSGDFSASGPGWLRGTVETPKEEGGGAAAGSAAGGDLLAVQRKPWSHFHLVFHDSVTGNIRSQNAQIRGDVRLVMAGSEKSELDLNVNEHATFPPDAFFLTCEQLGAAGVALPGDAARNLELTAMGNTRFDFQAFTGRGEVLKYDHRKRTVMMQGSGVTPAALSRQERPGAPVNTQTFSSASFNLETKNIDLNLSGTGYSPGN